MSENIFNIFDANEIDSIKALIDKLENSSFDFLKLESEGRQIVIAKKGMTDIVEVSATKSVAPSAAPQAEVLESQENAVVEPAIAEASKKEVQEKAGVVIISAPSHGIFYAQPEPGAPPYVKIGSKVRKGVTVGLIEIMKVYSAILTHVSGEVIDIYVGNEELVTPDQPLIAIKVK